MPPGKYPDLLRYATDVIVGAPTDAWPMSDARLRRVAARTPARQVAHGLESALSDDEYTRVTWKIVATVAHPAACGLAPARCAAFATAAATELLIPRNAAREGP